MAMPNAPQMIFNLSPIPLGSVIFGCSNTDTLRVSLAFKLLFKFEGRKLLTDIYDSSFQNTEFSLHLFISIHLIVWALELF